MNPYRSAATRELARIRNRQNRDDNGWWYYFLIALSAWICAMLLCFSQGCGTVADAPVKVLYPATLEMCLRTNDTFEGYAACADKAEVCALEAVGKTGKEYLACIARK